MCGENMIGRHKKARMSGLSEKSSCSLVTNGAATLFFDQTFLDSIDSFLVVSVYGAATAVTALSCVQASLLDVPLCYFQVLINIHVTITFC